MPSKLDHSGCQFHGNGHHNHSHGSNYLHQLQVTPTKRRGPIGAEFSSPGPAIVYLPSTFGPRGRDTSKSKSPSYTFGSKFEEKREPKTPGPGEYDVEGCTRVGKDWTQVAFLGQRFKDPEPFNTPSPAQYSPERSLYSAKGRQAPSYTFGFKAKDDKYDDIPSPNAYNPVKSCANPSFTFGLKTRDPIPDATPAPTAYNVPEPEAYKTVKQPMFSFRPKTVIPTEKGPKPGPADYIPEKVWINKTSPPSMSFGSRPSPYALSF